MNKKEKKTSEEILRTIKDLRWNNKSEEDILRAIEKIITTHQSKAVDAREAENLRDKKTAPEFLRRFMNLTPRESLNEIEYTFSNAKIIEAMEAYKDQSKEVDVEEVNNNIADAIDCINRNTNMNKHCTSIIQQLYDFRTRLKANHPTKPIVSDEEIEKQCPFKSNTEENEIWRSGAKWMRDYKLK